MGARIKELVAQRRFQFIRLCVPAKGDFALRTQQREELSKWVSGGDYDTSWLKVSKEGVVTFVAGDGQANVLVLDDASWQDDDAMVSEKWQELCTARAFDCIKVQVGDKLFGLRSNQEEELAKLGDKKKYDKKWLHVVDGNPSHFEAQDGSENKLVLTEDAWIEVTGKYKGGSVASAPPAKKAKVAGGGKEAKKGGETDIGIDLEIGVRKDVIKEWASNWFCYWDGSFGMPADPDKNFLFKPCLEMTKSGVVRTKEWDLFALNSAAEVKETLEELFFVMKKLEKRECGAAIGLGSEADYPWHPFAVPWKQGKLSPQSLLAELGAHEQLRKKDAIAMLGNDPDFEEDEDSGPSISDVFLDKHKGTEALYFHTGSEAFNPVVVFAVAKMKPNLVAGFVGGIVHT